MPARALRGTTVYIGDVRVHYGAFDDPRRIYSPDDIKTEPVEGVPGEARPVFEYTRMHFSQYQNPEEQLEE